MQHTHKLSTISDIIYLQFPHLWNNYALFQIKVSSWTDIIILPRTCISMPEYNGMLYALCFAVVNVSFSATSLSADEGETVELTVELMGEATIPITVQLNTADGTATGNHSDLHLSSAASLFCPHLHLPILLCKHILYTFYIGCG